MKQDRDPTEHAQAPRRLAVITTTVLIAAAAVAVLFYPYLLKPPVPAPESPPPATPPRSQLSSKLDRLPEHWSASDLSLPQGDSPEIGLCTAQMVAVEPLLDGLPRILNCYCRTKSGQCERLFTCAVRLRSIDRSSFSSESLVLCICDLQLRGLNDGVFEFCRDQAGLKQPSAETAPKG